MGGTGRRQATGTGGKRIYHVRLDDGGGRDDADIADVPEAGGLEAALERKEQASSRKPVLDGGGQARPAMLACSDLPEGHARRTLRLPGDRLGGLEVVDSIPEGTVRQGLL